MADASNTSLARAAQWYNLRPIRERALILLTALVLVFDIAQSPQDLTNFNGIFLRYRRKVSGAIGTHAIRHGNWIRPSASREVETLLSGKRF